DKRYALSMVGLALPFIWIGIAMTARRLRSAGLPLWLVVLFFIPIANLVTLAILCIVPERGAGEIGPSPSPFGAVTALAAAITVCILFVYLATGPLKGYGVGLFIAVPFCLGFLSVLLYDFSGARSLRSCMGVASLSVAIPGMALLAVGMEGLGCLLMALPLALPLACLGGAIAWSVQDRIGARQGGAMILI